MKVTKNCISNSRKVNRSLTLISKINYAAIEGADELSGLCRKIAENAAQYCSGAIDSGLEGQNGTAVAALEQTITCITDDIVSIRCDFTVTNASAVIFHRRFCINSLLRENILLPPFLVRGLTASERKLPFYLIQKDGSLCAAVCRRTSVQAGTRIVRRADIDSFCEMSIKPVEIKKVQCLKKRPPEKKQRHCAEHSKP